MERFASIDIGTNSVLLLVAERKSPTGEIVAVEQRATITRLGQGVDRTGRLDESARQRTLDCLTAYHARLRELGVRRLEVVATSAMRDADGAKQFAGAVEAVLGVPLRVIAGAEEAELTFVGAISGLGLDAASLCVFDIGGGSTEIVRGDRTLNGYALGESVSLDIGSVRLRERYLASDPPTQAEYLALQRCVEDALEAMPRFEQTPTLIGVAGTVTTLAAIELGLSSYDPSRVHGSTLTLDALTALRKRFLSMSLERRKSIPGLHPMRADVILAGTVIVEEIVSRVGASQLLVSDRGVRWGLAERAL